MQGRNMDHRGRRLVGLAMILAVLPVAAWAHVVGFEGDDALARGVNISVLFLLSMPFVIVSVIFGTVYLAHRRAQRQRHPGRAETPETSAHRKYARHVLHVLAVLFLD